MTAGHIAPYPFPHLIPWITSTLWRCSSAMSSRTIVAVSDAASFLRLFGTVSQLIGSIHHGGRGRAGGPRGSPRRRRSVDTPKDMQQARFLLTSICGRGWLELPIGAHTQWALEAPTSWDSWQPRLPRNRT